MNILCRIFGHKLKKVDVEFWDLRRDCSRNGCGHVAAEIDVDDLLAGYRDGHKWKGPLPERPVPSPAPPMCPLKKFCCFHSALHVAKQTEVTPFS